MANKLYVKNECVDRRDGTRYFPGDVFPGPKGADDDEVDRLTRANCLTTTKPGNAAAEPEPDRSAAPVDVTSIRNVAQLRAIAKREGHQLGEAKTGDELRAAIVAGRQAQAG